MKNFLTKWGWLGIIEGGLFVILGLLTGILGGINASGFSHALCIVIAVFLFIDGAILLLKAVFEFKKFFTAELVFGALAIGFGVFLCTNDGSILQIILPILVAIALLTVGAGCLVKGIVQIAKKQKAGLIIGSFCTFVVGIALGVLCLVFKDQGSLPVIYIICGSALTVLGVMEICFSVATMKEVKKMAKEAAKSGEVVAVDVEEAKEEKEDK